MKQIYLDNADNLSYKERLAKELTFKVKVTGNYKLISCLFNNKIFKIPIIKHKSKPAALSIIIGEIKNEEYIS